VILEFAKATIGRWKDKDPSVAKMTESIESKLNLESPELVEEDEDSIRQASF
jgi:hypothetical protein